ncbi:hypothetical protein [uncultured Friedmanniella sp.]|uniref:hypothetical protein n=1 Tax=uncultured Friedmanniella sp. TaxID=335381 RepID=UPI0035C97FC1
MPEEPDEALGRLARVLTGDDRHAAELLGEVAVLARRPARPDDDGLEDRRALLVQRVLRRRRSSTSGSAAPPDPDQQTGPDQQTDPDQPRGPDHRPDTETRLARLDPLGRTLLVLRHAEHVTLAELARVTDRSPAAVARALEQAATTAEAEPYEVEQALWRAHPPAAGAVREAERRFTARRRRTRSRLVLASMAASALVAAATVLPGLWRAQPYARPYGEWISTVQLAAQGPFSFQGLQLSAGQELLAVTEAAKPEATCSVTVTTASGRIPVPAGRKATLGEGPARFVAATDDTDAGLWWSVGPRTSALAQCDDSPGDRVLLDLAGQVQFARTPVRVPFDLNRLPEQDQVQSYLDYSGTIGILVTPRGATEESPDAVFVGLVAMTDAGAVSGRRVDINGTAGRMSDDVDETAVCWPVGSRTVCAAINNPEASLSGAEKIRRTARVLQTARAVQLAPDLDQPGTWFDAQAAFPR